MEINGPRLAEKLVELVGKAERKPETNWSLRNLYALVRLTRPELFDSSVWVPRPGEQLTANAVYHLLLDLPEEDLKKVVAQVCEDLQFAFPVETFDLRMMLEGRGEWLPDLPEREKQIEKVNRYLRRIDGAILAGRYTLAVKLTNRCLREYYRTFLRSCALVRDEFRKEDLNQMAVQICRFLLVYARKYGIPYPESRILLISAISANINEAAAAADRAEEGKASADKALALYARYNVNRIIKFLSRFM